MLKRIFTTIASETRLYYGVGIKRNSGEVSECSFYKWTTSLEHSTRKERSSTSQTSGESIAVRFDYGHFLEAPLYPSSEANSNSSATT